VTDDTLLLRQAHPNFIHAGRVTSQAFTPTPKDANQVSAYDGDKFTPEASWMHYTSRGLSSAGVLGVSVRECAALQLQASPSSEVFEGHVSIDFTGIPRSSFKAKTKELTAYATQRGWQYRP